LRSPASHCCLALPSAAHTEHACQACCAWAACSAANTLPRLPAPAKNKLPRMSRQSAFRGSGGGTSEALDGQGQHLQVHHSPSSNHCLEVRKAICPAIIDCHMTMTCVSKYATVPQTSRSREPCGAVLRLLALPKGLFALTSVSTNQAFEELSCTHALLLRSAQTEAFLRPLAGRRALGMSALLDEQALALDLDAVLLAALWDSADALVLAGGWWLGRWLVCRCLIRVAWHDQQHNVHPRRWPNPTANLTLLSLSCIALAHGRCLGPPSLVYIGALLGGGPGWTCCTEAWQA